jgi:putative ABC transport system substrate-binding protein
MRRRQFITLLGSAAAAWPLAARAQQPAWPVIGFISAGFPGPLREQVVAFQEGLKESGYVEAQNVTVETRFAEGQPDRISVLAADFIRRRVSVLVVTSIAGALAAKRATTAIPIVFSVGDDPVTTGLVDSLNRPGGNLTGVYQFTTGLEAKRLGLLHEMVPNSNDSNLSGAETQLRDVQEAAPRLGVQLVVVSANTEADFDAAFSKVVQQRAGALLVCASLFFNARRQQLVGLATRHAVPAMYEWRDFAEAGGATSPLIYR